MTMPSQYTYSIIDALALFNINLDINLKTNSNTNSNTNNVNNIAENTLVSKHLVNDSRALQAGDIFCATIGHEQNGRQYIDQAVTRGAVLVIAECENKAEHGHVFWQQVTGKPAVAIVEFYQLNHHLFALTNAYYQRPQDNITVIGITGTNGKTTTCQVLAQLLEACNKKCAVIGTNGAGRINDLQPIANTTPSATQLHQLFSQYIEDKIDYLAMEVSSHALVQRRVMGELFSIAVFTNLSRDHLDYHHSMENYAAAKRLLFTGKKQLAVLNGDDQQCQQWLLKWPNTQNAIIYGRSANVTHYDNYLYACDIQHHHSGVTFTVKTANECAVIYSPLLGDFNIDNLLAAIAVVYSIGVHAQGTYIQGTHSQALDSQKLSLNDIAEKVKLLTPINGRMEAITADNKPTTIVDYAHTPDALKNALLACRQHCQDDLWLVFGCGGDRDKGKRRLMGEVAEQLADHVMLTNDNPRNENPEVIIQDILTDCKSKEKINVMLDRQQAVLSILRQAKKDDFILLAGKGHENSIVIGDQTINYNERALVADFYQQGANI